MSFIPKPSALEAIKTRTQKTPDDEGYTLYEVYLGTDPFSGKPVRKSARTEGGLRKKIADFYRKLDKCGDAGVLLTRYQAMDAKQAFDMLAQSGRSITLVECVRRALAEDPVSAQPETVSLGKAYEAYVEATRSKSEDYYRKGIRGHVGKWVSSFGADRDVAEVTAPEVKKYLTSGFFRQGDVKSWKTYNNHLGDIKTFMRWCAHGEQKFLREDPLDCMKKLVLPYRQPEYMKSADIRRLFDELWRRRCTGLGDSDLAYAVLSFFCGMRQSEIGRVRKGDASVKISIGERFIRVGEPKGKSKGVRPRTFVIPEQALAWMKAFEFMDGAKMDNPRFRRHLVKAAKAAGVRLPKNCGRHTFITMFEAVHHDANALTAIVGNSDDVRAKSYNGVELRPEGEAYFKILPPGDDAECGVSATPAAGS